MMQPPMADSSVTPVTPAMWKNGNVQSAIGRPPPGAALASRAGLGGAIIDCSAPPTMVLNTLVTWLRLLPTAPLGNPVVPEV
ncbi:MAG: hypothetical protein JWM34_4556 [Ilumatobacteraceae bacterium]|nr:hypothetical protein [Ilumatobacteraceae bacterium]